MPDVVVFIRGVRDWAVQVQPVLDLVGGHAAEPIRAEPGETYLSRSRRYVSGAVRLRDDGRCHDVRDLLENSDCTKYIVLPGPSTAERVCSSRSEGAAAMIARRADGGLK